MAENSKIEWTHNTFNPWIGCQKVSPGCDHLSWKQRHDKARATRALLHDRFPLCINPPGKGKPKQPLARHIDRALMATCPDLAPEDIKNFLAVYTSGKRYWKACSEGAPRVCLDGTSRSKVSPGEARWAAGKLARRTARAPAQQQPAAAKGSGGIRAC